MPEISDASYFHGQAGEIFAPREEAELLEILARAHRDLIPVTFMGALTGLTGAAVPRSGWAVSLTRLNRLEILPGSARISPGAVLRDLQRVSRESGQFYAPDPTENTSTLGGNIAANASGSRSFKFGATRDHVLSLRVALIDGRVLDLRRGQQADFEIPALPIPKTTKFSAGYRLAPDMDLIDLFIGSEGTLGVITRAELKLLPAPGELTAGVIFFDNDAAALDAVDRWRATPGLRMLEYLDRPSLAMLDLPHAAALMIEQEGGAELDLKGALENESWFAISAADRERFRQFRHSLPERVNDRIRRTGFMKLSTDYAVPLDRNREMLAIYRRELDRAFLNRYVIFGHIGDAHVHINTFSESPAEFESAKALMDDLAREAVRLGGVVGAEHGLGKRKAHLLRIQYTEPEIDAMRQIKQRFDPDWLLGQGTLFEKKA
ncbi:MAG TPA: FAD-binding oxidoreductase [Bryobacteraceae bacterium]|nr:FAD-binding oxidoreductase [Bryobacteraceae bacterium]